MAQTFPRVTAAQQGSMEPRRANFWRQKHVGAVRKVLTTTGRGPPLATTAAQVEGTEIQRALAQC